VRTASTTALVFATGLAVELAGGCRKKPQHGEPIRVAAAADLSGAFEELGKTFEREHGQRVELVFGSSGLLAKQLREGAPFDLFAAANTAFVDDAVRSGACDGASKRAYAEGHIVLWWREGGVRAPVALEDLSDPRFRRIAIANPEHAPYGLAAKQALVAAGLYERLKDRLVYGENVRQTLQLAETGNVEVAVVALSLAKSAKGGRYLVLPESGHQPIRQAMVVCKHGANGTGGKRFAEFVASPDGRRVLERYGLGSPTTDGGD
jgi:molybdate transport system substrate-binding protein